MATDESRRLQTLPVVARNRLGSTLCRPSPPTAAVPALAPYPPFAIPVGIGSVGGKLSSRIPRMEARFRGSSIARKNTASCEDGTRQEWETGEAETSPGKQPIYPGLQKFLSRGITRQLARSHGELPFVSAIYLARHARRPIIAMRNWGNVGWVEPASTGDPHHRSALGNPVYHRYRQAGRHE